MTIAVLAKPLVLTVAQFVIHADFVLTANRKGIDRDRRWNKIPPGVFAESALPCL